MKLKLRVLSAGFVAVTIAVAFQNCGQGFSAGSGSQILPSFQVGKVIEGSGVKEAGLLGRNVLKAGKTTVAVASAKSSEFVTCSADKSSCLVENMPLLNQFEMPTPFASMYCAPTAATMIFEAMLESGFTFPRNKGPTYVALGSAPKRALWLGEQMQTSDKGTHEYPQMMTLSELSFTSTPAYDLGTVGPQKVTPQIIKDLFLNKGVAALNYGHFYVPKASTLISGRQTARAESTSGHAIALSGFRTTPAGATEIVYNDPGDETQYARVLERHKVNREDGVYVVYPFTSPDGNSSNYALFSADYGSEKYIALITKYFPIEPSSRPIPGQPTTEPEKPATDARAAAQQVVTESYLVLLKRLPDSSGLEAGIAYLLAGHSRTQFEDMIRSSPEYKNLNPNEPPKTYPTDALVQSLFQSLLKRSAEPAARTYASSRSCEGIGSMVAHSTEAFGFYNNQSNDEFVRGLYQGLLARTPTAGEVANWTAQLTSVMNRTDVIWGFVKSPEFANRCAALGVH